LSNLRLFAACVAIWGTTWLAITFQLGHVSAEASVAWRFLLASALLFAYCAARGLLLRQTAREHAWLALQGALLFGVSYVAVYYAETFLVSGVVAVGYSASPLLGMLGMRAFFATPMTRTLALGSVLGLAGISLVYWPEVAQLHGDRRTVIGAAWTAVAVLVSTLGSLVAHRNQRAGIPLWQSMAWGMLYGALASLAMAVVGGTGLAFDSSWQYLASLAYLAVLGSIVAFAAYLTLLHRVGAGRSGYIGVMVPIVALVVSSVFEGFRWHALTFAGIAVSVAGNVLVLRGKQAA